MKKSFLKQHRQSILFFVILFLAIFTRFYQLGSNPISLYWDEAAIMVDAKVIAATGTDQHNLPAFQLIFPSYGDYKLGPYIWLASASVKIFGPSAWAIRLPAALASIFTIIIAGLIAFQLSQIISPDKKSTAQNWQLSTMFILTISPWAMMFGRTAFEGHLAQALLGAAIYFLLVSRQKYYKIFISLFFGILATYTYYSVRFVFPFLILFYFIFLIPPSPLINFKKNFHHQLKTIFVNRKIIFIQTLKYLLIPIFVFLLALIPSTKAPFYNETNIIRLGTASVLNDDLRPHLVNQYRAWSGNNIISRIIFSQKTFLLADLAQNYAAHLNPNFIFISGDPNLRHGTNYHGLFLWTLLPFAIIGLYQLCKKNINIFLFLIAWIIIGFLPASVPMSVPHSLRSLNNLIPFALIIAYGLSFCLAYLKNCKNKIAAFAPLIIIIPLLHFFSFNYYYFNIYPATSSSSWQAGSQEIAQLIARQKNNYSAVNIINYETLLYLWFYHQSEITPQMIQSQDTRGFQIKTFENINFSASNSDIAQNINSQLVISTKSNLEELFTQYPALKSRSQLIYEYQTPDKINFYQAFAITPVLTLE